MELTSEPVAEPPLASAAEPALAISTEPTPPILTELPSPTPSSPLTPLPEEISEEEELEVEEDIPKRGRKPTKPKAITTKRKSKKMRKNGSEPDPHVTTLESLKGRIIPLMWSDTWQEICDTAPYFGHFVHGFSYTTIEMEGILIDEEYGITCSKWDNEDAYLNIRPVNTKQSKFETVLKRLQYNQSGSLPLCLAASQEGSGVPFHLPVPYSVFGLFTVEDITPDAETHSSGKRRTCNWSLHLRAFRTDAHRWWKFYAPNSDFVLPDNIKLALSKKPTPSSDPEATLEGLKLQAELFKPVDYYTLVAPGAARLGESTSAREIKVYTSVSESWIITQRKDEKDMSPTEFIENLFCGSRCRECGKISLRKFWTVFECSCCKTRRVITQMHWHPNLFKHRHTLFDGIRRYGTKEKSTGWFNRRMSAWDDQVRTYTYTLGEGKKRIRIAHVISSGNADILDQVANVLNDVVTIPDFQRPINDVTKELEKYYYYPVGMGEGSLHPSIPMTSFDDTQETGEKVTLPLSDFMLGCAGRTFLVDGVPPWDVQLLSVGNDQTPPYSPPIEDPGRKPFRVALTTLGAHCEVTIQPKDGDKESRLELNMTHGDFVVLETTCSLRLFKVKRYDFGILVLCLWN
ncbi:hypothetical protein FRC02_010843 [Tulasnella sp. 418]|nr:hypothetical protein FRC02_010843 [Tulasnella sp. 418]